MSHRYTAEQKQQALDVLESCGEDTALASAQTGIPAATLRRWVNQERKNRRARAQKQIERAHIQLADDAFRLSAAIGETIEGAPLNQLATALNAVIDRYLKLDEHLATCVHRPARHGNVMRVRVRNKDSIRALCQCSIEISENAHTVMLFKRGPGPNSHVRV